MNSPAEKYGAVVGDDTAPEWCSYDDAVGWLRAARGLSEGAALNQANEAIASGNVQRRGRWTHQLREREQFGQDFVPALDDAFLTDVFLTDMELNFADFCAQIELQTGSPRSRVANRKPRPPQGRLNAELLEFAKARGQKVKQTDGVAREMLIELGARKDQIRAAFRSLPEDRRRKRGERESA